jgi:hypothetical protein
MEIITVKRHGTASHDSAEAVSKSNENVRKEKQSARHSIHMEEAPTPNL